MIMKIIVRMNLEEILNIGIYTCTVLLREIFVIIACFPVNHF
jgi:hypothetical protein